MANAMPLHCNGFQLENFPSGQGINWEDEEQVQLVLGGSLACMSM